MQQFPARGRPVRKQGGRACCPLTSLSDTRLFFFTRQSLFRADQALKHYILT
jgi:hypothetical protein